MRVRTDFTSVNLKTGERTRHIVGDGQRIEETVGPINVDEEMKKEPKDRKPGALEELVKSGLDFGKSDPRFSDENNPFLKRGCRWPIGSHKADSRG